ncbi:MAG: hypothetical protein ACJ762_19420 [Solirubrobacteraceae bacterium]
MQVLSITKLLGWATLVGGALSAALAALLFLGPMLGFYEFGAHPAGPRTTGAVELPAPLVQQSSAPQRASLGTTRSTLGTLGTIPVRASDATVAPVAPVTRRAPRPRISLGSVTGPVTQGAALPPVALAPAPVITPAPVVQTPAPVADPAPVAAAAPTTSTPSRRPVTPSVTTSPDKQEAPARGPDTTAHDDAKAAREAARAQRKQDTAAPAGQQPDQSGAQDQGDAGERGSPDYDHDQGRGNGHARHDGKDWKD